MRAPTVVFHHESDACLAAKFRQLAEALGALFDLCLIFALPASAAVGPERVAAEGGADRGAPRRSGRRERDSIGRDSW